MSETSSVHGAGRSLSRRARILATAMLLLWGTLAGRLVHLQWIAREELVQRADRQRRYVEPIPARPGEIVDRHGHVLAMTVARRSLYVDPGRIDRPWDVASQLADALKMDRDALFERIRERHDKQFLWIRRRLQDAEVRRVRELGLPDEVWGFRDEYLRGYPQGRLAAHVLGLRNIDGRGVGGIEQVLDDVILGRDGVRVLFRDARGHVIRIDEDAHRAPEHGRTVVLTMDSVVQADVESGLDRLVEQWKPRGACAIVMNPINGEILAAASRPAFDPNHPARIPANAWVNLATAAMHEPGSTFKPFVIAWAIETGLVQPTERFDCEHGKWCVGPRTLHDHHPYGELSVSDILVRSSNIGMAKIGRRLTNQGLFEAALRFGFGRRTGIELPGEVTGIIRPLDLWDDWSTGSVPMGQEIAVTPIQMIAAYGALANGGRLVNPHLVLDRVAMTPRPRGRLSDNTPPAVVVSQTVDSEIARWIVRSPLTQVVQRGTGQRARLAEYTVFGKTGTAQKFEPATHTYSSDRYVCSFVCGAPARRPRVLVLVVVDEPTVGGPHYGGTVAAPVASMILQRALIQCRVSPVDEQRVATHGRQ